MKNRRGLSGLSFEIRQGKDWNNWTYRQRQNTTVDLLMGLLAQQVEKKKNDNIDLHDKEFPAEYLNGLQLHMFRRLSTFQIIQLRRI